MQKRLISMVLALSMALTAMPLPPLPRAPRPTPPRQPLGCGGRAAARHGRGRLYARQACDQGTGHPRMEPAEKAGSGEITIAISRSILSNKCSKASGECRTALLLLGERTLSVVAARERLRGFQTGGAHFIGVKREHPPAGRNFPRRGHFQSFSTPGHPAACHAAHSTSFSALESFFRATSRRRAVRLSAQRSI